MKNSADKPHRVQPRNEVNIDIGQAKSGEYTDKKLSDGLKWQITVLIVKVLAFLAIVSWASIRTYQLFQMSQ